MKRSLRLLLFAFLVLITVGAYLLSPLCRSTRTLRVSIQGGEDSSVHGYRAVIVNSGYLPVLVGRCETVSDAMSPDIRIGDVLQRWRREDGTWMTVAERNECGLVPLGVIKARSKHRFLWPRQQLHSAWFFPSVGFAGSPFQHGDKVRFLVLTYTPKEDSEGIPSPQFMIE